MPIVCIEGLRGWMAWWVVVAHLFILTETPHWLPLMVMRPTKAVNVFIIISGFVITHLLQRHERYGVYLARRFLRIAPIYLLCFVVSLLLWDWYRELTDIGIGFRDRNESISKHLWEHAALHLTLLHGIVPAALLPWSPTAILGPAWSLSLEWQFYVVAPLLIGAMQRGRLWLAGIALMLATVAAIDPWSAQFEERSLLPQAIGYFLAGILSRLALPHLRSAWPVFVLCAVAAWLLRSVEALIWGTFLCLALVERGIVQTPAAQLALRLLGTNPIVRALGRWSYSTYLVHIPAFVLVAHAWRACGGTDMQAALGVGMGIVAVLSPVLYRFVECPFIRIGRRLSKSAHAG